MAKMRKYEFANKELAYSLTSKVNGTVVHLGHIVLAPAIVEGFEVVKDAELSAKWHVDILFDNEVDTSLNNYIVWAAPLGVHSFWNDDAINEYKLSFAKNNK